MRHVAAGPFEGLQKNDLPSQLCGFVRDVLRVEVERDPGHFDLVHSHYWLSGQIGTVTRERWGVPLVHTMHTMAKVKNAQLAAGDIAEPIGRIAGEEEIVRLADRLIANTDEERRELVELYGADPKRVEVVHPGVDLEVFRSGRQLEARRAARGARRRRAGAVRRPHPAAQGARRRHRGGRPSCSSSTRRCADACASPSSAGPRARASTTRPRSPTSAPASASTTS